jgi:hypothetical protein
MSTGKTLVLASDLPKSRKGPAQGPHGWIALHGREFAQAKAAANARAHVGGSHSGGSGGGAPVVSSYANVSPSFSAIYQSGVSPPDTTGAIGPDRYVQAVNTQFSIYSRTGTKVNSNSLSALTGVPGGIFGYSLSDPQMMWDAATKRFYYSAVYYDLFMSDNGLAVGWSKTATPSSAADFCKYTISFGSELPDYQKLGTSGDFLLYGYNLFGNSATTYDGSGFSTLNKPAAGSTCPSTSGFVVYDSGTLYNGDTSQAATPVPAKLVDDPAGASGYVVANTDLSLVPSANFATVFKVTTNGVDGSGRPIPAVSNPITVPVPSYSMPSSAAQKGSSYLLDTLDGRFESAVAAVDPGHGNTLALWTAHAVYGGAGVEERWYEIDPTGSLLQSGVVSDPSFFAWNGTVSPDRANNGTTSAFGDSMAMTVSTSATTAYPAIQFLWKKGASTQSALMNLVQATGPAVDFTCTNTGTCRWGDYSGASPDPAATNTGKIWLTNQYNLANGSTSGTSWRSAIFGVTPKS